MNIPQYRTDARPIQCQGNGTDHLSCCIPGRGPFRRRVAVGTILLVKFTAHGQGFRVNRVLDMGRYQAKMKNPKGLEEIEDLKVEIREKEILMIEILVAIRQLKLSN